MVGVPGRSKGCITCRKKKKGCDLKRPTCGQCDARGLSCGGYEDGRIFINHSARAEPATLRYAPTYYADTGTIANIASTPEPSMPVHFRTVNLCDIDIVLPHSLARTAHSEKFLQNFFTMYPPSQNAAKGSQAFVSERLSFTGILSNLYGHDEALRLALLAVGTAMQGTASGDENMVKLGRMFYCKGLKEMQRAISDERRVGSEALVAAPRVYGIFEMLFGVDEPPAGQAKNWRSHAYGKLALMGARGPKFFADGMAHQIFVEGRMVPIFASIYLRRATPMNEPAWKQIPWEKNPKRPKDLLVDIMAEFGGFLEDLDKLFDIERPFESDLYTHCIRACRRLDKALKSWATTYKDLIYEPETEEIVPYKFPNAQLGLLSVLYWTCGVVLYEAFPAALDQNDPLNNARFYARRVALSVPYYFEKTCGVWGAIMVSFPMANAILHLRKYGLAEDRKHVDVLMVACRDPKIPNAIKRFLDSIWTGASEQWHATSA